MSVSVMQFGAIGDGVTNDTGAFVSGLAYLVSVGGGVLSVPKLAFRVDPIILPAYTQIRGDMEGPFDGSASPVKQVNAPTLLVNSTGSAFVTLGGAASGISDILIFHPQQVASTASRPNTYPPTIMMPSTSAGGNTVRRMTLVNSFIGINCGTGRSRIEDCNIGSYRIGILLDGPEDYVFINNIIFQAFYDTYFGLSVPQSIDAWVMSNSIGIQIGRADAYSITNVGMYAKFVGFYLADTAISGLSPTNSYGNMQGIDLDSVAVGIQADSTNPAGGGAKILNLNVGANSLGVGTPGQAALSMLPGGINAPIITWSGGGVRGTWVAVMNLRAGSSYLSNIRGFNP